MPAVHVALVAARGLRARGRRILSCADAARVLAPFLDWHRSKRSAVALLDDEDRLLAIAQLDNSDACCVRPSDVFEPAIVVGATRVWFAHRHRSPHPWATRQDRQSTVGLQKFGDALGLTLVDHLIFGTRRYASLLANLATGLGRMRNGVHVALPLQHPLPARLTSTAALRSRALPARRSLGFDLVGLRTPVRYAAGICVPRRPRVASHLDAAPLLAPFLGDSAGTPTWVAGLLDSASRLFAVVTSDATGAHAVSPADVYRAVIVLGARRVYLAHRNSTRRRSAQALTATLDLDAVRRVHALGFGLGRELCDVLVFDGDGGHVSLRELGAGVAQWREALRLGDPGLPTRLLRLRQAGVNRRPMPQASRHREAALAALWRCRLCERRQIDKLTCRYCGTPRPL